MEIWIGLVVILLVTMAVMDIRARRRGQRLRVDPGVVRRARWERHGGLAARGSGPSLVNPSADLTGPDAGPDLPGST